VKAEGKTSFPEMPRFEIVAHPERYFPSGVIGDPMVASSRKGRLINDYIIENTVKLVKELVR
jgi:creatinine amidohydrolase/Fe(II)-dependent formamide hydrolase-like protein